MRKTDRSWTQRELALLGTDSDRAIAEQIGRTITAIKQMRAKLGITRRREWSRAEVALLGTMPDSDVAARVGCSRLHVLKTRRRLGVPAFDRHAGRGSASNGFGRGKKVGSR